MVSTWINTIKRERRAIYENAFEVYKEWRAGRDEALEDGWAYYCRHGFHDNAEGLCGPCEMGADGFFWDWREEIKIANGKARNNVTTFERRFEIYKGIMKHGGVHEELNNELAKWVTGTLDQNKKES